MGNHGKNIFWPLTHQTPKCILCHNNDIDTWPHLLLTCGNPYMKGLRIAWHNKAVHLITQTLQANKITRFFTLTNAGNLNNKPPDQTFPHWLLKSTCTQTTCQCQAKIRLDILCIIGAPKQTLPPISPSLALIVEFIEFLYCHDIFPNQALTHNHTKYNPLINIIQKNEWKTPHYHHSWGERRNDAPNLNKSQEMQFASFFFQIFYVHHQDDFVCMIIELEINYHYLKQKMTSFPFH